MVNRGRDRCVPLREQLKRAQELVRNQPRQKERTKEAERELVPEVADMIVDCPVGVVVKIFVPHEVYYHLIGEYAARIHDE